MVYYEEVWFWLIIIGAILVIAALIAWALTIKNSTPWWVWLLLAVGVLLIFIAIPIYLIQRSRVDSLALAGVCPVIKNPPVCDETGCTQTVQQNCPPGYRQVPVQTQYVQAQQVPVQTQYVQAQQLPVQTQYIQAPPQQVIVQPPPQQVMIQSPPQQVTFQPPQQVTLNPVQTFQPAQSQVVVQSSSFQNQPLPQANRQITILSPTQSVQPVATSPSRIVQVTTVPR